MKPKKVMFCVMCRKNTGHTPKCEARIFNYKGIDIDYYEEGWICNHCGEEQQTVAQFDKAMKEVKETYFILNKG